MLDALLPIADACRIEVPPAHRKPVAIIGAGVIVDVAHLPAYARAGVEVRALHDLDHERAKDVAARHGVPRVHADVDDLLADPEVAVVDIAVHPAAQPELARRAMAAGKHVLCQKPLALDLDVARSLVDEAETRGLRLAVNQQMRFDEGLRGARAMVDAGWIGEPTHFSVTVDIRTDWTAWPWLVASPQLDLMFHSIHYLDSIRAVLGDADRVFCTSSRRPGQVATGETRTTSVLVYPGDLRAVVNVNHENLAGDYTADFRIDGTSGSVRGTFGLLRDYPRGWPDTVEIFSQVLPTDGWLPYPVTTRWIPDAFAGPMASLLASVADGTTPETDGRDNLRTLRLVEALYASAASGECVRLERERVPA